MRIKTKIEGKEVTLLNKIEQIISDLLKRIFSYVCTCICSIIAIGIMEIKKIYSVKRVWYGDSIVILNNNIILT